MAATERYPALPATRLKLRSLGLLLRYSGLRIGDAVTLTRERIAEGKLLLRTSKTGVLVQLPLPPVVTQALESIGDGRYFFWTGCSKPKTAITDWQEKLTRLCALAEVEAGHAHRFRDTFATELLLAGVPLERVSVLLGHSSIRITERHYAPWVRARQEQLEADVRRTWAADVVVAETRTKRTQEVRGQTEVVN